MAKEVFANGREISSKKSGTMKVAACPDVCFSPGPPPKIGIPIPYPNFSKPSTLKKGSKTVKIKRKPVTLKNSSFYKTSFGDDPATPAFKKGAISGKIKGKCYASLWSFDVKFEKKNVVRYLDPSRHNNGNTPC